MKRIRLSNREIRQLRETNRFMAPVLEGADVVEIVPLSEREHLYLVDGEALFLKIHKDVGEYLVPTLSSYISLQKGSRFRRIPRWWLTPAP